MYTRFIIIRKIYITKWASETTKLKENVKKTQNQMSELKFLKMLIFPRAL